MIYKVLILDNQMNVITRVTNFLPLDNIGNWLEYSRKLSGYGLCRFRVGTKDPLFGTTGDIFQPFANNVQVWRNNTIVWQGTIVNVPHRTKNFVEIEAYEFEYMLDKVLIKHDPPDGNGAEDYRTLQTGTLATALQTLLTEIITDPSRNLFFNKVIVGEVDNPSFPAGSTDANGVALAGQAWDFSKPGQALKFNYQTFYQVAAALGAYTIYDFELVPNSSGQLVFNFKPFIGNPNTGIVFSYITNRLGELEDYDVPLNGKGQVTYLTGLGADFDFQIIQSQQVSPANVVSLYGRLDGVAAFNDTKNLTTLAARTQQELLLMQTPDTEVNVITNTRSIDYGLYNVGDYITLNIQDHFIKYNQLRRLVGTDVKVHVTGKDTIKLITNPPNPAQPLPTL